MFEIKRDSHLLDVIATAGGLTPRPALVSGRLVRAGKLINLDVLEAFVHPEGPANVLLKPGDLILLEEKLVVHYQVEVRPGEAARKIQPGRYDDAWRGTGAGRRSTPKAALTTAYIMRKGLKRPVRSCGGPARHSRIPEIKLEPDDILVVPENTEYYRYGARSGRQESSPTRSTVNRRCWRCSARLEARRKERT